jgi:4-amino-4-deoxy-L-arabinose transferase-like glycosyltransferase
MRLNQTSLILLIILATALTASGMLFPVLGSTFSPYYGVIAKHIVTHNDWINLTLAGQDWLDKPHLPFWITAISFKIFGINSFAYILPGFIFNLIGACYTYKLSRIWYNVNTSLLSVLLYLSTLHLMLSSIDVRAEAYLLGEIIPACYYLLKFYNTRLLRYLLLGSLFSGLALMTKGMFVLVTIGSGIICLWLYNKQFKNFIDYRWWLYLVLTLIIATPELLSLYLQFDLHPEKIVFNMSHVSGIKWFVWDSQFGRFFNTGPIATTNPMPYHWLFFVHTFLWAFLPWWPLFFYSVGKIIISIIKKQLQMANVFLLGSFVITFVLFSATSFQVDHYTNIIFPFACIITAKSMVELIENDHHSKVLTIIQTILSIFFMLVVVVISYLLFNFIIFGSISILVICLIAYTISGLYRRNITQQLIFSPLLAMLLLFVIAMCVNGIGYINYDVGYNMAKYLNAQEATNIIAYRLDSMPLKNAEFHSKAQVYYYSESLPLQHLSGTWYIITPSENANKILTDNKNARLQQIISGCEIGTYLANLKDKTQLVNQLSKYAIIKVNN